MTRGIKFILILKKLLLHYYRRLNLIIEIH